MYGSYYEEEKQQHDMFLNRWGPPSVGGDSYLVRRQEDASSGKKITYELGREHNLQVHLVHNSTMFRQDRGKRALAIAKGMYNGAILRVPRRINDEMEERELVRKGLSSLI